MLTIKNYKIKDNDLKGLKIVFASDFHIKPNQKKRLSEIISLINKQNADIVLSTGDFVYGHKENLSMPIEDILEQFKNIKSKYGFYTALGNHDRWISKENIKEKLKNNNINVLSNSNIKIDLNEKSLYIAGLEDMQRGNPNIELALKNTQNPIILLTHSPDMFPKVPTNVNISFAGHVHGGQIRLPFFGAIIIPSEFGNKYAFGLIEKNHKKMIVTKGIGNSILPVRFNCKPEIVVIDFE
jgi:hypothetical protein